MRTAVGLLAAALLLAACGESAPGSDPAAHGCEPVGTIQVPTPSPVDRFGDDLQFPIRSRVATEGDLAKFGLPRLLGKLPLQGVNVEHSAGHDFVLAYYSDADPRGLELSTFYASGGVQLNVVPVGEATTVDAMDTQFPGRIVRLQVGEVTGGVQLGDPDSRTGHRQFSVLWNDTTTNWWLSGESGPEALVNMARQIACGSSVT